MPKSRSMSFIRSFVSNNQNIAKLAANAFVEGRTLPWELTSQEFSSLFTSAGAGGNVIDPFRLGLNRASEFYTNMSTADKVAYDRLGNMSKRATKIANIELRREYIQQSRAAGTFSPYSTSSVFITTSNANFAHRALVERAIRFNRKVPDVVRKEYGL